MAGDDHQIRMKRVHALYNQVGEYADRWAKQAKIIEISNLILTILTSGAFWALASDALPKPVGWIGAVISTVTTFLAIYLLSSGLNMKTKSALRLHSKVGTFLAEIYATPDYSESKYWNNLRLFENEIRRLKLSKGE